MKYEKKYKEALERARQFGEHPLLEDSANIVEYIFPELKESEDDRIRKGFCEDIWTFIPNEKAHKYIAWLEKQDKPKEYTFKSIPRLLDMIEPTERAKAYTKKLINTLTEEGYITDAKIVENCLKRMNGEDVAMAVMDEKQGEQKPAKNIVETWKDMRLEVYQQASGNRHEPNCSDDTTKMFSLNDIDEIVEKMSEQSPTDRVEPKFHKGEWLCENEPNNYARFIQILEIVNIQGKDRYIISRDIHKDEDVVEFGFVEKYYHKFDIQDAKDGDVIQLGIVTVIFREYIGNENCKCYCSVCDGEFEIPSQEGDDNSYGYYNATPATKEQRDLLFAEMHEAGWEWDEDKKELNRMVAPIFNIGDIIAKKHNSDINKFGQFTITDITGGTYWYNDRIICDITEQDEWELYEPVRQKPIWSDEDERMFQSVLIDCSYCGDFPDYPTKEEQELYDEAMDKTDWLKSIKERMK